MAKLAPGLIRIPDVSIHFVGSYPANDPHLAVRILRPDLAIEVLSPSNTSKEMAESS